MDPSHDPFAQSRASSDFVEEEGRNEASIGVAITADQRLSPTPSGHRTTSSVSTAASRPTDSRPGASHRIPETLRRWLSEHNEDGSRTTVQHHDDRSTSPKEDDDQATPTGPVHPHRMLRRLPGHTNSIGSADGSISSIESTASPRPDSVRRPRRARRPPVSMRRVYNQAALNPNPPSGPAALSPIQQGEVSGRRHSASARWPASLRTVSNENNLPQPGVPGITIETPSPPADSRIEELQAHGQPSSPRSFDIVSWNAQTQSCSRPVSRPTSGRSSLASGRTNASTKKSLKVSFVESDTQASGHSRDISASTDLDMPEEPELLHPSRAFFGTSRNPFDDSFGEADHRYTQSDHGDVDPSTPRPESDRRRSSTDRSGFLRRFSRSHSTVGPFDTTRKNSGAHSSQPFARHPSLSGPGRTGSVASTGSASERRPKSFRERYPPFRDPFRRRSIEPGSRRKSESDMRRPSSVRRPSSIRRLSSYVVPENPIPRQYRSRSVSNLAYFVAPLEKNNNTIPIFSDRVEEEKENVEEFLAAVEVLQSKAVRKPWQTKLFKVLYFGVILSIVYFVFIGQPIWDGLSLVFYRWINSAGIRNAGSAIFMSWAGFQAFAPLLGTRFEQEVDDPEKRDASEVAVIIPAYKAAKILPETIRHALQIFKPEQIFIVANGNSPTPLDDTAEVCKEFGVNVAWVPIGSKITAEFVGVALTSKYKYILLIDDDVHLPANLPMVTDRIQGKTKCIGYTIKSTGENGSKGTLIQQCQDVEYKLSGLTRTFCGRYGSATFPHGAIILWERATLQALFNVHPGYSISEDWFFGYAARASGHRIQFCSQVFVETETPPSLFFTNGPARGGFGEMTVFKQRFYRWNFFWSHRLWEDTVYILFSWRLGWHEIVTKIWVLVELYDCVMSFLRPWVIILAALANWKLLLIFIAALTLMYALAFIMFNAWHLRKKNEMVAWKIMPVYMSMKFALMWVNVVSVYYDLYCYAKYFSVKHPRVIETRAVLEAAYKARLGANMVPLDKHLGEATEAAERAEERNEKVQVAEPLDGLLPLAAVTSLTGH